jgi:hypothetical protein
MVPLSDGLRMVLQSLGDTGAALAERPLRTFALALYDPGALSTFNEAEQLLLAWLRAQQVTAIAPPNGISGSPVLDPAFWNLGEVNWEASSIKGQYDWPGISGIKVDAGSIARLIAESAPVRSNASRETACRMWLEAEMQASPTIRPMEKECYRVAAKQRFVGLGKNEFNRAWSNAISNTSATAWRGAGRPRKSSR